MAADAQFERVSRAVYGGRNTPRREGREAVPSVSRRGRDVRLRPRLDEFVADVGEFLL
jgi:hypothetical protein